MVVNPNPPPKPEVLSYPPKMNNFLLRTLSAVFLIPIVLWVFYGGGFLYFVFLILTAYLACQEYSHMCGRWPMGVDTMCAITTVALSTTAFYMLHITMGAVMLVIGSYLTYTLVKLRASSEKHLKHVIPSYINRPLLMGVGTLYMGMSFSSLAYLHKYDPANFTVIWMLGCVVCSDISAYIFGNLLKGAKLAPSISPGKTWSGFLSAIVMTFVVSYVAASLFNLPHILDISLLGAVLSIVAHVGDLLESALKRHVKIKDSGTIIPGHGGVLDRIDALMLVATVTFFICIIAGKSMLLI